MPKCRVCRHSTSAPFIQQGRSSQAVAAFLDQPEDAFDFTLARDRVLHGRTERGPRPGCSLEPDCRMSRTVRLFAQSIRCEIPCCLASPAQPIGPPSPFVSEHAANKHPVRPPCCKALITNTLQLGCRACQRITVDP